MVPVYAAEIEMGIVVPYVGFQVKKVLPSSCPEYHRLILIQEQATVKDVQQVPGIQCPGSNTLPA